MSNWPNSTKNSKQCLCNSPSIQATRLALIKAAAHEQTGPNHKKAKTAFSIIKIIMGAFEETAREATFQMLEMGSSHRILP